MLSKKQITEAFMNTVLEENYNFLEDALVKLANAFVKAATPGIAQQELQACFEVTVALNPNVANKLLEVRGNAIKDMK